MRVGSCLSFFGVYCLLLSYVVTCHTDVSVISCNSSAFFYKTLVPFQNIICSSVLLPVVPVSAFAVFSRTRWGIILTQI